MPARNLRAALRAAAILLALTGSLAAPAQEFRLTILHTNDIHGHVRPFAYAEAGRGGKERLSVGGAARRAALIRRLRASIRPPVVLVDAGDVFTRGALTNAYEGVADVEGMNATGYDLAAIGNNEFKARDGVDQGDSAGAQRALLRVVKRSRFPWVCANVTDQRGAILEGVQPYIVRRLGRLRVGFLGLTAPRSGSYPQTRGWTFRDPVEAAREWVPKARRDCDVLVAVTHIGDEMDRQLARAVPGVDAIVGGDSHTFLYKPAVVKSPDGRSVPIAQDGEFGVNVGRLDLTFRKTRGRWQILSWRGQLIPVGPSLRDDSAVAAALAPFLHPFDVVVGRLAHVGRTPAECSTITTQAVVDAMRRATGADLALNPLGGGFFDSFRSPLVTRYDLYAAMPFHNNVAVATLRGAEVQKLLSRKDTVVAGDARHVSEGRTYKLALVDFVATSDYKVDEARLADTGIDLRVAVADWLRSRPRSKAVRLPARKGDARASR